MRGVLRGATILCLVGCTPPLEFDGEWSCEDKPNRPTYAFDATTQGPEVDVVFVDPIFAGVVSVGSIELQPRRAGTRWSYEGKLPRLDQLSVDLGLADVGLQESCDDITSVLFDVVYPDGSDEEFEVRPKRRSGGG